MTITASIVLYNENINDLKKTVDSFLKIPLKKTLYLIDNSPTNFLKSDFQDLKEVVYFFVGKNSGFGAAHNLIIDKIYKESDYHLILNPDVTFLPNVIPNLIAQIQTKSEVIMVSPKVLYEDGSIQYTCRKHPSIFGMIARRTPFFKKYKRKREYRNQDLKHSFYPEFIHGSFLLFKTEYFLKIEGFDERYFLYMEDADICRKIDAINKKKMYFPDEQIYHIYRKGSSKSLKLFFYHLVSAFKYFLKWGV